MLNEKELTRVKAFAAQIRVETLKELAHLGFGHVGGAMSIVETLAVLYGKQMKIDPANPQWEDRDWYIQSKGHAGPATYATLALKGYFPLEWLNTLNQGGTNLPSHCDRNKTPGVDMTTGSLGQGVSCAIGVAHAIKMDGKSNYVYLMVGDGELNEGQVWEGAMYASAKNINNLIWFVDWNKQQLDGNTEDVLDMGDLQKKFESFGFNAVVVNGHCVKTIDEAIDAAKAVTDKPSVIILDTIKGYGCSSAEGVIPNHHINFKPGQLDEDIARWQAEYETLSAQL